MKRSSPWPGSVPGAGGKRRGGLRLTAAAAVVTAMVLGTTAPARAASASPAPRRVTFGIEPASAAGADGRPHFAFGATPGALVEDHVAAVNYSAVPLTLALYATDAVETTGGGFGLLPAGVAPTGVGAWIELGSAAPTVTVPPRTTTGPGQVVVPVTVRIPRKASPGDHVGGIVASLQTVGVNRSGQKVVLDQRVGTRVFVRVSGRLAPRLVLGHRSAVYQGSADPVGHGQVRVRYLISNTGNEDLSLRRLAVTVSDPVGATRHVALADVPLLLPGASVAESVEVPGVWPEFLVHESETVEPLTPSGQAVPSLGTVTAGSGLWAVPWTLVAIVVAVIVALVVSDRVRNRSRRHTAATPSRPSELVSR